MSTSSLTTRPMVPGGVREMLAIAVPMVVSSACDTIMTFTSRLLLSRLGAEYMSAAMAGGLTCFMLTTFFVGLIGYSTALVAQYLGSGQKRYCAAVVTQALLLSLLAYPVILLCRPLGHWMFGIAHIPPEQLVPQGKYFDILLWGSLLSLLRTCFSGFFSGIGRTRTVMVAAAVSMVTNIAAEYSLIYGHFGLPRLGIVGAGVGMIIGSACGVAVLAVAYFAGSAHREFNVAGALRLDMGVMRKLLRFGYPGGIEMFLNLLAFDMLILAFHSRGLEAATAVTVVFNWDMVSFLPLIGVNIAVTSLVGRYMGAGDPDTAHRATMSGLRLTWMYGCCTMLAFSVFPGPLVHVFRPPVDAGLFERAQPIAIFMLRLASLYVLADATNLVFSGALRGAGDTVWAMGISVGLHWVLVGALLVALHLLNAPVQIAWIILVVLIVAFTVAFYLRYRTGKWRLIHVVQREPEPPPATTDTLHEVADL